MKNIIVNNFEFTSVEINRLIFTKIISDAFQCLFGVAERGSDSVLSIVNFRLSLGGDIWLLYVENI